VEITVEELATTIGVSPTLALRGIDRLARFGFIRRRGNTLSVRHFVGLVTEGRVQKLSPLAQRVDRTYRQRAGRNRSLSENQRSQD
jgi:DNA-binding MarR family transcriptional regulator